MGFLGAPTADLNYLTHTKGIFLSFLQNIDNVLFSVSPNREEKRRKEQFPGAEVIKRTALPFGSTRLLSEAL